MKTKLLLGLIFTCVSFAAKAGPEAIQPLEFLDGSSSITCESGFICGDAQVGKNRVSVLIDGDFLSYVIPDDDLGAMRLYLERAAPCDPLGSSRPVRDGVPTEVPKKLYVNEDEGLWSDDPKAIVGCEIPMI